MNLRGPTIAIIVLLSSLTLVFGCQDMLKGMGELMSLQQKIAEEFDTRDLGIKIMNGKHLTVTFQNSDLAELPKYERESKARQVALFVRDNYQGFGKLFTITVVFSRHNRYGPVSVTKTQGVFSFKTSELNPNPPQV
jgi:hypothetical protein